MNRLNELQAEVGLMHRSGKVASDAVMAELFALLRSAASETVGTEWEEFGGAFIFKGSPENAGCFAGSSVVEFHHRDLAAARVAVAEAKRERDDATKILTGMGWTKEGQAWKPPIGPKPDFDWFERITGERDAALAKLAAIENVVRFRSDIIGNSSATLTGSPTPATAEAKCGLCGEPMPPGEEMFQYHGYSGPCPNPQSKPSAEAKAAAWCNESPRKRPARRKGER